MEAILEAARDMADLGLIDKKTLRGYERLCAAQRPRRLRASNG